MDMEETGFNQAHKLFLDSHVLARRGESRGRLERGSQHAETLFLRQVWWPLEGGFSFLHPEYEVADWRGRSYYADFAWLPGAVKLLIEIKGYAAHVRDMDRDKYCRELNRETFLHAMGYSVISFAYDDVERRPELCQTLLRMVLSRYKAGTPPVSRAVLAEKELIRLAARTVKPIKPKEVKSHFDIDHRTAILMLDKLCQKGWLSPVTGPGGKRIMGYSLIPHALDYLD